MLSGVLSINPTATLHQVAVRRGLRLFCYRSQSFDIQVVLVTFLGCVLTLGT